MRFSALGGFLLCLGLTARAAGAAERWDVQFFHDEDKSSLTITALAFPTTSRGLASGVLTEEGDEKAVTLVTSDGGAHWTQVKAPEPARSLFCLDEASCWMAGARGVWFSSEAGRDWRRVFGKRGIVDVFFTDHQRGWAVGAEKALYETRDGGKNWKAMPVQSQVKTNADRTVFHTISFVGKAGVISGRSEPPERSRIPLWMDPEVQKRRERPALSIMLLTADGGETWTVSTSSIFGRVSNIRGSKDGRGVALLEFDRYFSYPSEVFRMDMVNGKNERSLRESDFAVTDLALVTSGPAFAAGFVPLGKLARAPIPGKVRVMKSLDLDTWTPMEVDYRAVARRVMVAAPDAANAWIATDTGMILRLVRD